MADVPAGTGLGSSGTFTVGLLKALSTPTNANTSPPPIWRKKPAISKSMRCSQPVGKQDQYIAAFGGLTCFRISTPTATVTLNPLAISNDTLLDLEHNLLMFFTGYSRNASVVLGRSEEALLEGRRRHDRQSAFHQQLGMSSKDGAGVRAEPDCYGELMREHWEHKRARSQGMSNEQHQSLAFRWHEERRDGRKTGGRGRRRLSVVLRR